MNAKYRILIVEDDDDISMIEQAYLEASGFETFIVSDGDKVLPLLHGWKVYKGEQEIRFPNREFELLKFMAENPNIVFSKEQLFDKIWGYDYVGDSV